MEKRTPHTKLVHVNELIESGNYRFTASASKGSRDLGLIEADVIAIIAGLTMRDFYKSMTTNINHAVWQDVYIPATAVGRVYLKLMVFDDVLIVSFKEK